MLGEQQRKQAFNTIILTQCLGMVTGALFQNGFYLNYFSKLGVSSATIALLFSVPPLLGSFLLLPFAYHSDRMGKKRLALAGQVLLVASLLLMMSAAWGGEHGALSLVVVALLVFCAGGSLQGASWFALMSPIVPKEVRGRFFGRLRVTFMTVCILFTLGVTRLLKANDGMPVFQSVLGVVLVAAVFRFFTYARIPELEDPQGAAGTGSSFIGALRAVLASPGIVPFNAYILLVTLFTAGVPIIFGLMQKDVFDFTPAQITMAGTLFLGGNVTGNLLGGRVVDRFGTRPVFRLTHLAYAAVMLGMLARPWMPWPIMAHAYACSFLFSLVGAAAGVAITSEVMALIPAVNKSLSTAVNATLINLSTALAGLAVARSIGWDLFPFEWRMAGEAFTAYDALLLLFSLLALLMLLAIGLVPRIKARTERIPQGTFPRV